MKFLFSLLIILSVAIVISSASENLKLDAHLKSKKNTEKLLTEDKTECSDGFTFLATPFTQIFTFNSGDLQNTGPIKGAKACGVNWILGSVITKSQNKDHVNFLLGDIQTVTSWKTNPFTLWTWWDDNGITPALNFGGKLVAITNPGEKDNWSSFYGNWRFVMIPLKDDGSFDIIPGGYSQGLNPDYIGFNLIAVV